MVTGESFRALVEPYRRELHVHCYRMLGSIQDAEDMVQETLMAAWRGFEAYEGRASIRSWLYRIATNRCLNALRDGARRPRTGDRFGTVPPPPTRLAEPTWLQPYPDSLLDGVPDAAPGPEARVERREAISLAFVTAMQSLPPRQRAVLLLRDVLGYRAAEVAQMLDTTQESVTSALKRARAAMPHERPARVRGAEERALAEAFADAMERGDVPGMIALLSDDAWLTMPPAPQQYQGPEVIGQFMRVVVFRGGARRYRLIATAANGQPAFGAYGYDDGESVGRARGVLVLTLDGDRISAITRFDQSAMPYFGLPEKLP
ncbi:sigma-70 family RNA polymerase sigma factor [Actinoplanes subtropicus]|uniref:sigma-70 family RNA polymerase sigma factor n=1 Tax=Actinoplanes subtropicus TaxID=543632 RepID=UPI0004C36DBC|nr:sigma-70 family RNA polymerase sigma factor [Actinoplanes subtropicus]